MALLLTFAQQQAIKAISANNQSKYDQLAIEVENSELLDLIGIELYQDLVASPTSTANAALLNGSSFVNGNGNTINHKGLRYIIAYLNYSKYIGESYVNDTFTGFVAKRREESDRLQEGEIRRLQEVSRKIALTAWVTVKEFLDLNYTDYPLWSYAETKKIYTPKFNSIKKTKYIGDAKYSRCFTTGKRYIDE